jgi:hypothetical protein
MRKYFTSIDIVDGKYVGTVYDANTNQATYTSKPYLSQSQAMQDINTFLVTSKPPTIELKPQTIVNTAVHSPGAPTGQRRCCGR